MALTRLTLIRLAALATFSRNAGEGIAGSIRWLTSSKKAATFSGSAPSNSVVLMQTRKPLPWPP
jgi:hypothetical protein